MRTSVTFKNIDPSEHLKAYVGDKLNRFDKYLHNPAEASVVLSVEKFRHIAEINIVGDRMSINGREETEDMYSAIDMVLDKLDKQIKKNRQKKWDRRSAARSRVAMPEAQTPVSEEDAPARIHVSNIDYKPMHVDEAIEQMELVDQDFMVFTNARTNKINVIYRRSDGDYGLIQPSN